MAHEEKAGSGAALTFPIRAGEVKKGSHVVIKGHACKVRVAANLDACWWLCHDAAANTRPPPRQDRWVAGRPQT